MPDGIKFPKLIFEKFFDGKVVAKGHMIYRFPNKRIKNIQAEFKGNYKNNILYLREKYFEEETKSLRKWKFTKKSSNSYSGIVNDVIGNINVTVKENNLEMNYLFKIHYKNLSFTVTVKDPMFMVERRSIVNITLISKFGINIAKAILLYTKL